MKLKDTITMMTSEDEHERLKAEYLQASIRFKEATEQSHAILKGAEKVANVSYGCAAILRKKTLREYMQSLEAMAAEEGIDLKSLTI